MPVDERVGGEIQLVRDRFEWALAHPDVSDWVKSSLTSARPRDPIDVLNDLELMTHIVRQWAGTATGAIGAAPIRAESLADCTPRRGVRADPPTP